MSKGLGVPEGLAAAVPGLETYAVLTGLRGRLGEVSGFDLPSVLTAYGRLISAITEEYLAAVWETATRGPVFPDPFARKDGPDEAGVAEVRMALSMSQGRAGRLVNLAGDVLHRLPALRAALAVGDVDQAHAKVFIDNTGELPDDLAQEIVDALLGECMGMALPELQAEILERAMEADPDWAERVLAAAVAEGNVTARHNPDGTIDISGRNLPPVPATAAVGRLDYLAKQAKREGDPRAVRTLRVIVFLGLNSGEILDNSDAAVLAYLRANRPAVAEGDGRDGTPGPGTGGPGRGGTGGGGTGGGGTGGGGGPGRPPKPGPGRGPAPERDPEPAPTAESAPQSDPAPQTEAVPDAEPGRQAATAGPVRGPGAGSEHPSDVPAAFGPGIGVHLRVKLSTLLGLDRHPGALAGHGPLNAAATRAFVLVNGGATWTWALCDEDGYLLDAGITPARPAGHARRDRGNRANVEIRIPKTLLYALLHPDGQHRIDPGLLAAWRPVLADIAARHEEERDPPDPTARFPDADLRRLVLLGTPTCVGVCCNVPSRRTEVDHVRPHGQGGPTLEPNLKPACTCDHRLKTKGGYTYTVTGPHEVTWTTPLGATYLSTSRPLIRPLPDPRPRTAEPYRGAPVCGPPVPENWETETSWREHRYRRSHTTRGGLIHLAHTAEQKARYAETRRRQRETACREAREAALREAAKSGRPSPDPNIPPF